LHYRCKTSISTLPTDPEGGLTPKYAVRVEAMSVGATRRLIFWAGTPLPAKKIGT
jgi:hypothetical protein